MEKIKGINFETQAEYIRKSDKNSRIVPARRAVLTDDKSYLPLHFLFLRKAVCHISHKQDTLKSVRKGHTNKDLNHYCRVMETNFSKNASFNYFFKSLCSKIRTNLARLNQF